MKFLMKMQEKEVKNIHACVNFLSINKNNKNAILVSMSSILHPIFCIFLHEIFVINFFSF